MSQALLGVILEKTCPLSPQVFEGSGGEWAKGRNYASTLRFFIPIGVRELSGFQNDTTEVGMTKPDHFRTSWCRWQAGVEDYLENRLPCKGYCGITIILHSDACNRDE
jgi:hypothetical protein